MVFRRLSQSIRDINARYGKDCLGFHILLMVYSGFWPLPKNETNRYLRLVKFIPYLAMFGSVITIVFVMYDLTNKLGDPLLLAENLVYMISVAISISMNLIGCFKIQDVVNISRAIEDFSMYIVDEEEKSRLERCRSKSKWYTIGIITGGLSFASAFAAAPLLDSVRRFPIHLTLPSFGLDWTENPYFGVFYILSSIAGLGTGLILAGGNALTVSVFLYCSGFFDVIQYKLENGHAIAFKTVMKKNINKDNRSRIGELLFDVDDHHDGILSSRKCSSSRTNTATRANIRGINHWENLNVPFDSDCSDETSTKVTASVQGRRGFPGLVERPSRVAPTDALVVSTRSHVIDMDPSVGEPTDGPDDVAMTKLDDAQKFELDREMERHLGECVKLHTDLLSLIDVIQKRLDYVLFTHIVSGAISMCLAMFLTQAYPAGSLEMFLWSVYLFLIFEELYGLCWSSSELNAQSTRLSDALYFCDWTEASPSYKRSMQIIMSRAVVPVEISTVGFMTFNMEVFSDLVNSAYSYFNVMKQITKTK